MSITPLPAGALGGAGLTILACGLAAIETMSADAGAAGIGWRLILCGIGFGLFQSPNMVAIMQSAPRSRIGSAGGILAMSRLLGQSVGAAAVAFCLTTWSQAGIGIAIWLGVAMALAGGCISFARLAPGVAKGLKTE